MHHGERTAIVTGAGKRVGAEIAARLVQGGWTVIAHVRSDSDPVPDGTVRVAADLARSDCADAVFAAARELPPVRLLVNNAARFAPDALGSFDLSEFEAHQNINVRAPILLTETFAARHCAGDDGLVVNILDSKLVALNPDYLSYTLSKQGLAGFTQLAARSLAHRGIRVNAIAPSLMLRSAGQSEANFAAMHDRNPLGRGPSPGDVSLALDYLIDARTVTGEMLVVDGGQRFAPPERDVQFLDDDD